MADLAESNRPGGFGAEVWRPRPRPADTSLRVAAIAAVDLIQGGFSQMASRDINVIALVKGEERYVFLYDDDSRAEALETLARHAANPELSFSWYDAAVLAQKVRQQSCRPRRLRNQPRADRRA